MMKIEVDVGLALPVIGLFLSEHNDIVGFGAGDFHPADGIPRFHHNIA